MNEETRILLVNNLKPEDYMIITDNFRKLDKEIERLKSLNEKAIELLNREYWINEHEHNDKVVDELLNILQGGDK